MCSNLGADSPRHSASESALKAAIMGHQQRKGRERIPQWTNRTVQKSEAMGGRGRGERGAIGTPKSRTTRKCQ